MAKKKLGRRKGRRTKGYFFRSGRGWYTKEAGRFVPLHFEDGTLIREKDVDERLVQEAHARSLLDRIATVNDPDPVNDTIVFDVCEAYLAHAKATGAPKTFFDRADTLFDFCFGLAPKYRNRLGPEAFRNPGTPEPEPLTAERKKELKIQKIHEGLGKKRVASLTPLNIDRWLNSHSTWSASGRRTRIQAIKRALNYAVERKMISVNPIRGYRTPRSVSRVTNITSEQEAALLQAANPALRIAILVCIRTGARFGSEFTTLTKRHVKDADNRMEWVFKAAEIKNRRDRVIRITDTQIIDIVREQAAKFPIGPIFRNLRQSPWTSKNLFIAVSHFTGQACQTGHRFRF